MKLELVFALVSICIPNGGSELIPSASTSSILSDNPGNLTDIQRRQPNIIYDITQRFMDKNRTTISPEKSYKRHFHESGQLYFIANRNAYNDTCYTEIDDENYDDAGEENDDDSISYACGLLYGIVAVSVLFQRDQNILQIMDLPLKPMTNETIIKVLDPYQDVGIDSLVLSVKVSTLISNDDDDGKENWYCYCDNTNEFLSTYLETNRNISRYSPDNKTERNSTVKLALEYNETLIDCCEKENFDALQFADEAVLRIEFYPLKELLSYGIFSDKMRTILAKNRQFVRNFNRNCTSYVRVTCKWSIGVSEETNHRYQQVLAKYVQAWMEQEGEDEIFIVSSYPVDISLPENFDYTRKAVSPVFYWHPDAVEMCHIPKSCVHPDIVQTVATGFNHLTMEVGVTETECFLRSNCFQGISKNGQMRDLIPNITLMFTFYQERKHQELLHNMVKTMDNFHLQTIFFFHQYNTWSSSEWTATVELLRWKNVEIGCSVFFFSAVMFQPTSLIQTVEERCGPLLNVSSKVLYEWHISDNVTKALPKLLLLLNETQSLFHELHPQKLLIPKIIVAERHSKNGEQLTVYCDDYSKRANDYYDSVLTFANIHQWPFLELGPVILGNETTGWWRKIQVDTITKKFVSNITVLIRSNVVEFEKGSQLPKVYPCIQWSSAVNKIGINFLNNEHLGATFDLKLRQDSPLSREELEKLLLFSLGRFSTLEVVATSMKEVSLVVQDVLTSNLLEAITVSRRNAPLDYTLLYVQVPLTVKTAEYFDKIEEYYDFMVNHTGIHLSDWENHITQENHSLKFKQIPPSFRLGLTVKNCINEINLNLTRLKLLPFIDSIRYVVCNVKPILPNNFNRHWMQKYLDTLFFIKSYLEMTLPERFTGEPVEVIFRINLLPGKRKLCARNGAEVENLLRFLNDLNQHSMAYKIRYFVAAFEGEAGSKGCSRSWWRLKSYGDLTNTSVYEDIEDAYFERSTKLRLQLPPSSSNSTISVREETNEVLVVIVSIISVSLMMGIVALGISLYRMRKRYLTEKEFNQFYHGEGADSIEMHQDVLDVESLNWFKMKYPNTFEIPKRSLELGRVLGSGEFGVVHHAILLKDLQVAVKVPRCHGDKQKFKSALTEVKILCYIGSHQNVVIFLGAYTKEIKRGKLFIVTEFCENGSLQDYLREKKKSLTSGAEHSRVDAYQLYKFGFEIAAGMEYIAGMKIIHGDLATRNVLLDSEYTCKITDFGLSRRLYEMSEYIKKSKESLPWRWMAPESLNMNQFTTKSDVWSYGITLWEIFSLGMLPYPGKSWSPEFAMELEQGGMRMPKAEYASSDVHQMLLQCWSVNPDERPSFVEMKNFFGGLRHQEYAIL